MLKNGKLQEMQMKRRWLKENILSNSIYSTFEADVTLPRLYSHSLFWGGGEITKQLLAHVLVSLFSERAEVPGRRSCFELKGRRLALTMSARWLLSPLNNWFQRFCVLLLLDYY